MKRRLAETPDPAASFEDLLSEVRQLNRHFLRYRLIAIFGAVALAIGGYAIYSNWQASNTTDRTAGIAKHAADAANGAIDDLQTALDCQDRYEKAQRARLVQITKVNAAKDAAADALTDATDALIDAAVGQRSAALPSVISRWQRAKTAYNKAKLHYAAVLKRNPIPPLPKFLCAETVERSQQHPGSPSPSVSRVPGPTATVHVAVPGPVRTRVIVRTVTAPPGKARHRHHGR